MDEKRMEKIVSLCKRRGFIFPGSEIYGGLANTYDYGPMGAELLRNIKNEWWEYFIHQRDDIVGLDSGIISSHKVWDASGHTSGFTDAMIDCKNCKYRMRADHLIEDYYEKENKRFGENSHMGKAGWYATDVINNDQWLLTGVDDKKDIQKKVEGLSPEQLDKIIENHSDLVCPACGAREWTKVRKFNLLFPVKLGIIEGEGSRAYLRGETAQNIFINFENVLQSSRVRLPFGIGQVGKAFRNEITMGNFTFRTIEFEQGEIEYFFDPEEIKWEGLFDSWKETIKQFVTEELSIRQENLRWRTHTDEERSFYSKRTEDLEYNFPFGFKELWGLAYRTNYDLSQHEKHSGKDLKVVDPQTGKRVLPHVIEPAVGITRLFLMVLIDAYHEEEKRTVLKFHPKLAPYKAAVFPLLANKEELVKKAREVYLGLKPRIMVAWDDRGNIGKRYLSQDEIGTPWCVTIDFQTLEDNTVTIRDRDTTEQGRVAIEKLVDVFQDKLG